MKMLKKQMKNRVAVLVENMKISSWMNWGTFNSVRKKKGRPVTYRAALNEKHDHARCCLPAIDDIHIVVPHGVCDRQEGVKCVQVFDLDRCSKRITTS